jgi:hypothetical protein
MTPDCATRHVSLPPELVAITLILMVLVGLSPPVLTRRLGGMPTPRAVATAARPLPGPAVGRTPQAPAHRPLARR